MHRQSFYVVIDSEHGEISADEVHELVSRSYYEGAYVYPLHAEEIPDPEEEDDASQQRSELMKMWRERR